MFKTQQFFPKPELFPQDPDWPRLTRQNWNGGDFQPILPCNLAQAAADHFLAQARDVLDSVVFALSTPRAGFPDLYSDRDMAIAQDQIEELGGQLAIWLAACAEAWIRFGTYDSKQAFPENQ